MICSLDIETRRKAKEMKIYVAAGRSLIDDAERLIDKLTRGGHAITYDWTKAVRSNPPDDQCTYTVLIDECSRDIDGVIECDQFVLLAPKEGGTGCWVELGMALLAPRAPFIVIIGAFDRTIFRFAWDQSRRSSIKCFRTIDEYLQGMRLMPTKDW